MCKSYCTQNDDDCGTCSLKNYGRDCQNNGADSGPTDSKTARLTALALADSATSLDAEQAAQQGCLIVDILPSLPDTVADLYHHGSTRQEQPQKTTKTPTLQELGITRRWEEQEHPEDTREYQAVCKALSALHSTVAACGK